MEKAKFETFEELQKKSISKLIQNIVDYKGYTEVQRSTVKKLQGYLQRKGMTLSTRKSYLQNLKLLFKDINKDPKDFIKEDLDNYLDSIERRYMPKTIFERRKFLILFFEWFYGKKKEEIDLIKDISIPREKGIKLPEELLNPSEVKQMVQVADNFRDKALVVLLYETGSRKGEFLQLKNKHIDFTNKEYGLVTIPMGKTDSRKLPLIYSVPHLQNWINSHPRRTDPDAPLFVTQGAWLGRPLGEDGLKRLLKVLGKRAGIKKRIYPHLFRHARMTELGKQLKEQELKKFAGWTPSSNMAEVYVHLSGEDVTNKLLANAGLIDGAEYNKEKDVFQAIKCPRCAEINGADIKYCKCGFCLDLSEVNKMMDEKKEGQSEMIAVIRRMAKINPENLDRLFTVIEKIEEKLV